MSRFPFSQLSALPVWRTCSGLLAFYLCCVLSRGCDETDAAPRSGLRMTLLNEKENAAAWDFVEQHKCEPGVSRIAQITVTPTGIADNIQIKCLTCGTSKDISDYESW